jgi:hypothetical protein
MLAAMEDAAGEMQFNSHDVRVSVAVDALGLSLQHGDAIRMLLEAGLGPTALGVLRMQYESLTRAVWVIFAAPESSISKLAAPLTLATLKAAKNLGLPQNLLEEIEASNAPPDLKRSLREVRTSSWDVMNSTIHAALYALRRSEVAPIQDMLTTLRSANGFTLMSLALLTILSGAPSRQRDMNVVAVSFSDCMPSRHHTE